MDGLHLMVKVTRDSLMDVSRFLYSISRLFPIPYFSVRSQMSIVELDWSPSWSLASHLRAFCTLPSFARIKRPRLRPVELNDGHPRPRGKQGTVNSLFDFTQAEPLKDTTLNTRKKNKRNGENRVYKRRLRLSGVTILEGYSYNCSALLAYGSKH